MTARYRAARTGASTLTLLLDLDTLVAVVTGELERDDTGVRLAGNIAQLGHRVDITLRLTTTTTAPLPVTDPALARIRSWFGADTTIEHLHPDPHLSSPPHTVSGKRIDGKRPR